MTDPRPRMETCEPRHLLAFVGATGTTVTGTDFQTVDRVVPITGGSVTAGIFGPDSDFGNGLTLQPRGRSDVFLTLVSGRKTATIAIGGESRQRLKFNDDDLVDFAALPRRATDDFVFGVSTEARRADEYVSAMKLGPDGKLYVALLFRRTVSLDTQNKHGATLTATAGFEDEFFDSAILRFDISGKKFVLEKTMQIGGPFNDFIQDFAFDSAGNLVVAGSFERACDFDPGKGVTRYDPSGRGDAFVAKYAPGGRLQWVSRFGSDTAVVNELECAYGIAVDAEDDVYVGGTFAGDADFDRNADRAQRKIARADDLTDGFTMKLDDGGGLDWVRVQGGSKFDGIRDVTPAPDGGVYAVGYFEDKADLDPRDDREQTFKTDNDDDASTDLFFTRFDADGNVIYNKPIAGTGSELLASASTASNGDLVLAGSFYGTADFDPSAAQRRLTTPETGNNDANNNGRDNAYSGFVASYGSSSGRLRNVVQIDGRDEQDVLLTGASLAGDGRVFVAGRYRVGFTVPDSSLSVRSPDASSADHREDGFSIVFSDSLAPIV